MLDTMHVVAQDRQFVPDTFFAVLALTLGAVRVFRFLRLPDVLLLGYCMFG